MNTVTNHVTRNCPPVESRGARIPPALTWLTVLALVGSVVMTGCVQPVQVAEIQVGEHTVYFKRWVWGRDGVRCVLSPNDSFIDNLKQTYVDFDERSDYVYRGCERPFYWVVNGQLHLYDRVGARPPSSGSFPVDVVQHRLTTEEFVALKNSIEGTGGIKRIHLPGDAND